MFTVKIVLLNARIELWFIVLHVVKRHLVLQAVVNFVTFPSLTIKMILSTDLLGNLLGNLPLISLRPV